MINVTTPILNIVKHLKRSSIEEGLQYLLPTTLMLYIEDETCNIKLQQLLYELNIKYVLLNNMFFVNYIDVAQVRLFSKICGVFQDEVITILGLDDSFSIEKNLIYLDKLENGTILNLEFAKFIMDIDMFESELHILVKKQYIGNKKLFLNAFSKKTTN